MTFVKSKRERPIDENPKNVMGGGKSYKERTVNRKSKSKAQELSSRRYSGTDGSLDEGVNVL